MNICDIRKDLAEYFNLNRHISDVISFALYAIDKQDPVKPEYILHNNDIKKKWAISFVQNVDEN